MSAERGGGDDDSSESSQSSSRTHQQRALGQLPPLAPRESPELTTRQHRLSTSVSTSGRPARLSHRSRAGCWTCRGRKVKCDEIHPRCGPCQRLNRDCDWDLRWNFSDATSSTTGKYKNVSTAGNAVWDPNAQTSPIPSPLGRYFDNLPPFANLSNDQDREAKAETQRPGTYSVVVTPESFLDLPEYASLASPSSRRMSIQSQRASSINSPVGSLSRSSTRTDPNVVVLDRFEDVSNIPQPSAPSRRPNYTDEAYRLSLSAVPSVTPIYIPAGHGQVKGTTDPLVEHFRRDVIRRFVQPLWDTGRSDVLIPGSTRDVFELEAARSPPLYHAICAISTLHLSYSSQSSLEDALQYYHQAVSSATTPTTPNDLLSDSLFIRHFLLFLYDICAPTSMELDDADMWTVHLNRLTQIALQRHVRLGGDQLGYLLWTICELDMYACLLGSGNCSFVATVLQNNMVPSLEQQLPKLGLMADPAIPDSVFLSGEGQVFPPILQLNQGIVVQAAKLGQLAQTFRLEAAGRNRVQPIGVAYARRQRAIEHIQNEIHTRWDQVYPDYLPRDAPQAGFHLPLRVRHVYEHALLLYHAAIIYSRTSMFPGQRLDPYFGQPSLVADVENRCSMIIGLATAILASDATSSNQNAHDHKRHLVFPIFLAGVATAQADLKVQAIDLIRSMEGAMQSSASNTMSGYGGLRTSTGGGIGQNTHRTRQLLVAVCEEQRRMGSMESVEWLDVARDRGLMIVNCGL